MMNTQTILDEATTSDLDNPGVQLSVIREQRGYSLEYVASKLNLRVQIIELIESGQFELLPEPVFIKGYLRAYTKLLGVEPEPFIAIYDQQIDHDKQPVHVLRQSMKKPKGPEDIMRWFSVVFALCVLIAVGVWWQKNRDAHQNLSINETTKALSLNQNGSDINLTDLSKMKALLTPEPSMSLLESDGG